jgi:hypothetical protein
VLASELAREGAANTAGARHAAPQVASTVGHRAMSHRVGRHSEWALILSPCGPVRIRRVAIARAASAAMGAHPLRHSPGLPTPQGQARRDADYQASGRTSTRQRILP